MKTATCIAVVALALATAGCDKKPPAGPKPQTGATTGAVFATIVVTDRR